MDENGKPLPNKLENPRVRKQFVDGLRQDSFVRSVQLVHFELGVSKACETVRSPL